MRYLSFLHRGRPGWGLVTSDGIVDMTSIELPTLRRAIESGRLEAPGDAARRLTASIGLADVTFLPVIPDPGKILCIGHNYEEHRIETQRERTDHPTVFLRVAQSQVGHLAPMPVPIESAHLDYEGEIAIVIGRRGRRISTAHAWDHVAGYSAYNDGSVRDWQRHTSQFTPGKNFDGTGAFGPWLVPRGVIADGEELVLETRLNGVVMQRATTAMMIFPIPDLIAYVSVFTTLEPGDVIVTGTPGGVGARRQPPVWMKPGDTVEVEVSRVGLLSNSVVLEATTENR